MSKGLGIMQKLCLATLPEVVKEVKVHYKTAPASIVVNAISLPALCEAIFDEGYTRSEHNSLARAVNKLEKLGLVSTFLRRDKRGKKTRDCQNYAPVKFKWCVWVQPLVSVVGMPNKSLGATLIKEGE